MFHSTLFFVIALLLFTSASLASPVLHDGEESHALQARAATVQKALRRQGITGFLKKNGGPRGIGSWFKTNAGQDSTNGHSWCGYPYNDNTNGFAPDVSVMLRNFGGNYEKAAKAYCGLEAIVTTPKGKFKMYIADGFDPRWVRTPGSIDIPKNRWAKLAGYATNDKNKVIMGITWELTGKRSKQYSFKGRGN
jgi:hypothetical protein